MHEHYCTECLTNHSPETPCDWDRWEAEAISETWDSDA